MKPFGRAVDGRTSALRGRTLTGAALLGAYILGMTPLWSIEEVRASHILVATKQEASKIRQAIVGQGGGLVAFVKAARQYSKDATTKILGGDVGWFTFGGGGMDSAFTEAAFALSRGQLSEPVKSRYGWHLIYLTDRRERGGSRPTPPPPPPEPPQPRDKTGASTLQPEAKPVLPPRAVYNPQPRTLPQRRLVLQIESVQGELPYYLERQDIFDLRSPVQFNVTLKNAGQNEQKAPVPELLPLGFEVTRQHDRALMKADFSGLAEPSEFFTTLKTNGIIGQVVALNDHFPDLTPSGRYQLRWNVATFLRRLEERFPKVKDTPDYGTIRTELSPNPRTRSTVVAIDKVQRDPVSKRTDHYGFSIFERRLLPDSKYYARITVRGEPTPIVIELLHGDQPTGVQQFVTLALDGFYDNLNFYEVVQGDYALGGCPKRNGTGVPSYVRRAGNMRRERDGSRTVILPHERGTVSFIGRSLRAAGPVTGGEVGSIFFICLKEHPEWNERHVPFGKVVSGLEVVESWESGRGKYLDAVEILTEYDYRKGGGAPTVATEGDAQIVTGDPEAVIQTSKGNLRITLHERAAPNTVASFITLAEQGFYDKGPGEEKQKFFSMVADDQGKLLVMTGSPTNDQEGDPGYKIPDETRNNTKKCVRGALVMTKMVDQETNKYIPDSAGSQFFICLRDVPYYDYLGEFTVFGTVLGGQAILDKLEESDVIESIKITKKKRRLYERFRKVQ